MMKTRYIFLLSLLVLLCSCNQQEDPQPTPTPENSAWKIKAFYPSKVEVWSNGVQVEDYVFTFDTKDMLLTLQRNDLVSGSMLLDVSYSYSGVNDMTASCAFYPSTSTKTCNASIDREEHSLVCASNITSPWTISVKMDSNDRPELLSTTWKYNSNKYKSEGALSETYHITDGDIVSYDILGKANFQNMASTTGTSSRGVTYTYTYSTENVDNQNFGMFLLDCQLHVWAAAGLPGNKHLITGMTATCGETALPQSFTVTYKFNSDGDIISATRKDYNDNALVATREYKLYYN